MSPNEQEVNPTTPPPTTPEPEEVFDEVKLEDEDEDGNPLDDDEDNLDDDE